MQPEVPLSPNSDALQGLPPVTPPSGRFIAQLFLIPLLIVATAMGCIWFVTWLVGGFYTPNQFLKDLRSANPEVRWRRASDLAQVLKRDETLAADPAFALDLTELLRQALRDSEQSERAWVERERARQTTADDNAPPDKTLQDERAFIEYLIACVGNFSVPVAVPQLNEIAVKQDGADAATITLRRQLAVWALANVAENLKRYDQLGSERRSALLASLEAESATAGPQRRAWAQTTFDYLEARNSGKAPALNVDVTLASCARADDPALRKFVALALTFWEGTSAENARMEETLLLLSRDDGHGASADDSALRGREIRYQATQALARRGSEHITTRLPVLGEMLDEELLAQAFRTRLKDGRVVADGALVGSVLTGTLKSIVELQRRKSDLDLSSLYPAIDKLAQSDNAVLRQEAERTLIALKRK